MLPKVTFEIYRRKHNKSGKLQPFQFVHAFSKTKWQFALKLRKNLISKGYETLLREVTVTHEEKAGIAK